MPNFNQATFNKKDKSFRVYNTKNSDLINNNLEVIKKDQKGNLLLGHVAGFSVFNPKTEKFVNYVHDPKNENSISSNFIQL